MTAGLFDLDLEELGRRLEALSLHNWEWRPFTLPADLCGCGPTVVDGKPTVRQAAARECSKVYAEWLETWQVEQDRLVALIPDGERVRHTRSHGAPLPGFTRGAAPWHLRDWGTNVSDGNEATS